MKNGTVIEITSYDFNKYTDSIMVSDIEYDIRELNKEFCAKNGIETHGLTCLPINMVSDTIGEYKLFLLEKGFVRLDAAEVCISS